MRYLALLFITTGLLAQTTDIQVKRGTKAQLDAYTTYSSGQPLWTTDSLDFYVSDSVNSRHQFVGGMSSQSGRIHYAASAAGTDSFRVNRSPMLRSLKVGSVARFKADVANTGAAYLNVDSLGWYQITKNGTTALATNDILAGQIITVVFDGTYWQVQGSVLAVTPTTTFLAVPQAVMGTTASSWGATLNDTITVFAAILPHQITLGEAWLATVTGTGSAGTRGFGVAVYSSAFARLDTTAFTAWPGDGTSVGAVFQGNATIGPGLVYVAFSTYNNGTFGQQFRSPDISTNTIGSAMIGQQNTSLPIMGYATTKMTTGAGWPATITVTKSATTTLFPHIVLVGTLLD